ncbi:MAG: thymidine kinase [Monoraphidium minutum]|nr:MAG: thymidine kinase [Monoraphidium minutum]
MGPMFAGKSTALLDQVAALEAAGRRVALVKSAVDTRYARSWVVTHDGRRARCFAAARLEDFEGELGELLDRFDAVAIDEAQFFPDLLPFSLRQAEGHGRDVLVAGLSCDFMRRSFGDIVHLVPHAASVTSLKAACFYCNSPAPYTVRVAGTAGQRLVGGADMYRPACVTCYHECNAGREA